MLPNGSLIIEDVSINHEQNYSVRIVRNGPKVSHFVVSVKVYGKFVLTFKGGPNIQLGRYLKFSSSVDCCTW